MISRKGTRRSDAASGVAKILREDGSGPVVTAGRVVSGLERIFMASSLFYLSSFQTNVADALLPFGDLRNALRRKAHRFQRGREDRAERDIVGLGGKRGCQFFV